MTNAQKWVSIFLVMFILLFALQQLTKTEDESYDDLEFYGDSKEPIQLDGQTLVKNLGCIKCHGSELNGTTSGPSLYAVKDFWKRNDLINYLRNPSSYNGDARFNKYRVKYKSIIMPSFNSTDVKDLGVLSDYLLSLH